jgi:hypothetical protein
MKNLIIIIALTTILLCSCDFKNSEKTAVKEQELTEVNQKQLLTNQPPPIISWSMERDNLIKRFKLMNDRSVMFYMYVFIEGNAEPIGYYQVNKVSSVNSQLTNTEQVIYVNSNMQSLPSPAEDGSYGSNGDGVFGFTPEDIYIEHNMHYIVSTVPLSFRNLPIKLTTIDVATEAQLKKLMNKL